MTMPHLMNCDHSEEGWCLGCVKALHDTAERHFNERNAAYALCYAAGEWAAKRISDRALLEHISSYERGDTEEESEASAKSFDQHLADASKIVATWPKWKRDVLGGVSVTSPANRVGQE